jgi:hypothetical protein
VVLVDGEVIRRNSRQSDISSNLFEDLTPVQEAF